MTNGPGSYEARFPDQRSTWEQVSDLWRYARDNGLYDAQDWLAANWRGPVLPSMEGRLTCTTMGHEGIPADYLGIYDDGDHAEADVPYCDPCAVTMAQQYRVTQTLRKDRSEVQP